jgi:hypothetical protein
VLVVLGEVVGDARSAGMDVGPTQLLGRNLLAGRGLHQGRAAEEDRALLLDDHHLVAHRWHVRPARRATPHDGGDLGYALGRHPRLVVEDAPEVVLVRKDFVLQGQESPARVDQVHARQVVLLSDLLRPEVLFDRHRVVGAPLDGGVVRHDHDLSARDAADAGDDTRRRHLAVVHPEGRQRRELQERRTRIEE